MSEYLRTLFPHGEPTIDYININVLKMIDLAEKGETFLCENISKMLIELIQAGGTQARSIGLFSAHSDHVVVEVWSKHFNKWILIDPDYNVYYTNKEGIPLSGIELYVSAQDKAKTKEIKRIAGSSPNTLHNKNSKLIEKFYKNGLSIHFYNRWVDQNLPRKNPARSAAIMGVYVGELTVEKIYHKHSSSMLEKNIIAKLYQKP